MSSIGPTWLWHPLGYCPGNTHQSMLCHSYNFWSGIGSDISEITLIIGVVMLIVHHTCHIGWCWRPGRHAVEGTGYKTCRKHHPDSGVHAKGRTTPEHVREAFNAGRFGDDAVLRGSVTRDARGRFKSKDR